MKLKCSSRESKLSMMPKLRLFSKNTMLMVMDFLTVKVSLNNSSIFVKIILEFALMAGELPEIAQ